MARHVINFPEATWLKLTNMAEDTKPNYEASCVQLCRAGYHWLWRRRRPKDWERRPAGARVRKTALPVFVHLTVCLPPQHNEWRRLPASSCCRLPGLLAWRSNNEKERRVWYSTGRGREGDKGVTHTHMQTEAQIQVYMRTHTQTGHAQMQSELRWLYEKVEGQRPRQDRHQTKTHDLRVSFSQQVSHITKPQTCRQG